VEVDPKRKIAVVNEAICKGCGACAATCPSKAMQLKNFSQKQLIDVIDEATKEYAGLAR
jgi:heterodisulfide reductase subunit A